MYEPVGQADLLSDYLTRMILQIYISAAFDRVNHQNILYKLCSISNTTNSNTTIKLITTRYGGWLSEFTG